MKKTYHIPSLVQLHEVAKEILSDFDTTTVFLLSGDLGAGKTTLVKKFGIILGVIDDVVSPTYTLINEYHTISGKNVYHADLYRINSLEEAVQTGIEEYVFSEQYCFIEWPAIIAPVLPSNFVKLDITNIVSEPPSNTTTFMETQNDQPRMITAERYA